MRTIQISAKKSHMPITHEKAMSKLLGKLFVVLEKDCTVIYPLSNISYVIGDYNASHALHVDEKAAASPYVAHVWLHDYSDPLTFKTYAVYQNDKMMCLRIEDDSGTLRVVKFPLCRVFRVVWKKPNQFRNMN